MMDIINSLNEFCIYQDRKKTTLFCIKNNNNNNSKINNSLSLFHSILKINFVNSGNIINDNNNYSLIIKASSIKSFAQFKKEQKIKNNTYQMHYIVILSLINSLIKQLHYLLENESKCFYTFAEDNIIVIDDCKFIYLSNEHLKEVKNNNIQIYSPISKTSGYLSPELQIASSIPIIINYRTIFYSLGLFIVSNLCNETQELYENNNNTNNNNIPYKLINDINIKTNAIKGTKLYYFLVRCLQTNPYKRFLIYV
jgi:hypothetical protein